MLQRAALVMFLSLLAAASAVAQELGPYEGEAAVATQDEADRTAALPAALAQVLVRRTGDASAAADPRLAPVLAQAAQWLQQFRYRQDVDAGGAARLALIARFDAGAVDRALGDAGYAVWPEPRPEPVVWLAIDDGRGPRLLGSAQAQAVAALTARARQRGLRLTYPLLDLEDQRAIDAARVWAFDAPAAAAAALRYQSAAVLLGKLYRQDSQWVAEWQVLQDGTLLGRERSVDADSAVALAAGGELLVRTLRERYRADLASAGAAGRYRIVVEGIGSAEAYARLVGQLRKVSGVARLEVLAAEDDTLAVALDLSAGLPVFARSAAGLGLLAAVDPAALATSPDGEPARFRLLP